MSDLSIGVNFEGSGIEVDAEFGYSNTRYVSPSEYTGELTVVPSHERRILETTGKMLNGNVTVEAAPTSEVIFTENGEYLPPEGEVGFGRVNVNVPQKWDINDFLDNTFEFENGVVNLDTATIITRNIFSGNQSIKSVYAPYLERVESSFYNCRNLEDVYFPKLKTADGQCFRDTKLGDNFHEKFPVIETIGDRAFQNCLFTVMHLPETVKVLTARGINNCFGLKTVYFHSKPTSIGNVFDAWPSPHITDIYVPWSEGEVSGEPWGATSAAVHYDTVYDENWNVISST